MAINHGFHATMTAQPGKGDELVDYLLTVPSQLTDDCVVFLVGRSGTDRDTVHVTEGWTTPEAHSRFFATAEAQELVSKLQLLCLGEAQFTDEVPIGGRAAF